MGEATYGRIRRPVRLVACAALLGTTWLIAAAWLIPWPHPVGRGRSECFATPPWDWAHDIFAYMWARRLEVRWRDAQPRTQADLERHLKLYTMREIEPAESCWGSRSVLAPGERMVQYLLLWHAPLDVVYDGQGGIRTIFTSYE